MICASKLSHGIDIGGFVIRGTAVDVEQASRPGELGRERIGGWEITREVPDALWASWLNENARGPIVTNELVFAAADMQDVEAFCYARTKVTVNHSVQSVRDDTPPRPFPTSGMRSTPRPVG